MTYLRIALLAGCVSVSFALAAPASAALMQVGSLTGTSLVFSDAPGTTFAAGTPVSYTTAGQKVTFTAGGNILERDQANNTYIDSNYADGTQLIGPCGYSAYSGCNAASSLVLSFSGPVLGFSVAADDFDTTQSFTFVATAFSGSTSLGQVTASSLSDNGASPAILAVTSTVPITSISIVDFPAAGSGTGSFVVGNVKTVPAPEPSSIALLAAGLVGLVGLRKRRSRL